MRRALLLGLFLLWSFDIFAANSIVTSGHGCGNGVNAASTSALDTTGGDAIYIGMSWANSAATPVVTGTLGGVSDGNTYTVVGTPQDDGSVKNVLVYAKNANTGMTHIITATRTGGLQSLCVLAVAGSNLSSPLDQAHGNAITAGMAETIKPGATTPGEDGEILVTTVDVTASATFAIDSPFTISDQINLAGGVAFGTALAYSIQTMATPRDPTWDSQLISPLPLASNIASFKKAATGTAITSTLTLTGAGH